MSRRPRSGGGPAEWVLADLATGRAVEEAVAGVDAVVHLASATKTGGYSARVDVAGTRLLATAAARAGARHLHYVSIVGIDRVPLRYYKLKLAAEEVVAAGEVPWTILRAAQFPQLVDRMIGAASKFGVPIGDRAALVQPVDPRDVADRIAARLVDGPLRGIEEHGGPQTLRFDELARAWLAVRGKGRLLPVRIPGRIGRAVRAGALTTTATPTGTRTWQDYLAERYGGAPEAVEPAE